MDLPGKHILYLSKKIGARAPGSDGEAAAASYVLRSMNDLDVEVNMESFSCWKSDWYGLLLIYLLALVAYCLYLVSYTASLALAVFVFLVFLMETFSWSIVSRLFPHSSTSNVIGRVRPESPATRRVILVANYDTSKTSFLGRRRMARAYRLLYLISFICIVVIVSLAIFSLGASLAKVKRGFLFSLWLYCSPFAVYILAFFTGMLSGEVRGRSSRGANDNASGVAVMLSVLGSVGEKRLEQTDLWGVATARGFAGGRGMVALIKRHKRQLKHALVISIDHAGIGDTKVITREGVMLGYRSSRRLRRIAFRAAGRDKKIKLGKGKCRVKKGDAMVALARGVKAVTIGGVSGGTYQGWRNRDDLYDHVEPKTVDRTIRLVMLMLKEIDSRPSDGEPTEELKERGRPGEEPEQQSDGRLFPDDLADELPRSRAVVEVDKDDLLPDA